MMQRSLHIHPAGPGEPIRDRDGNISIGRFEGFEFVGLIMFSQIRMALSPSTRIETAYRTAACYVYAPGSQLSGSMRGSGI